MVEIACLFRPSNFGKKNNKKMQLISFSKVANMNSRVSLGSVDYYIISKDELFKSLRLSFFQTPKLVLY